MKKSARVLITVSLLATAGFAASPSANGAQSLTYLDAEGDTTREVDDLLSYSVSVPDPAPESTFVLFAELKRFPIDDEPPARIGFGVDQSGDGTIEHDAIYDFDGDGPQRMVLHSRSGATPCPASSVSTFTSFRGTASYRFSFPLSCVGGITAKVRTTVTTGPTAHSPQAGTPDLGGLTGSVTRYDGVTPPTEGLWAVASNGATVFVGSAGRYSTGAPRLNFPIVGMAAHPHRTGYWHVASDGGLFSYNVPFFGSTGAIKLNQPIVGMAATVTGGGYWLVASDGGIFSFGDAVFHGSTGAIKLNKPIVGMAVTPTGRGYWLVASDGGVFSFGDAVFHGSTGAIRLAQPIVGMAAPISGGYWMVAADGGVFAFGAPWHGSAAAQPMDGAVVAIIATPNGDGYRLVSTKADVRAFGNAGELGRPRFDTVRGFIVGAATAS